MKLPRYQVKGGNVTSGISIKSGLAAGEGYKNIGNTIVTEANKLGTTDIKHTGMMRTLDIGTKTSKAKRILEQVAQNVLMDVPNMDQDNPDSFADNYNGAMNGAYETVKKMYEGDKIVLDMIEADYFQLNTKYGFDVDKKINEVKISNASLQFGYAQEFFQDTLTSAKSVNAVIAAHNEFNNRTLLPNKGLLINDKDYKNAVIKSGDIANNAILRIKASENKTILSPDGQTNDLDYSHMLTNLSNTKFIIKGVDGKNIPVNDPLRQALIADTKEKLKIQTESYKQIETRSVLDVQNEISELATKYRLTTDTSERIKIREQANNIINNMAYPKSKLAMIKSFDESIKGAITKADENPGVFATLKIRAENKIIDTPQEFDLVDQAYIKNLITGTQYNEIKKIYGETRKVIDDEYKNYFRNTMKLIKAETGGKANLSFLDGDSITLQDVTGILATSTQLKRNEYESYILLLEGIKEAKRKNISPFELFADRSSPNYIVDKIITYAKQKKYDDMEILSPTGDNLILKFSDPTRPYNYDSTPTPERKQGETISEYLERIGTL